MNKGKPVALPSSSDPVNTTSDEDVTLPRVSYSQALHHLGEHLAIINATCQDK